MTALISVDDLLLRPGFDGVDESQAGAVIDDASALVLAIADLDTDWTTATVPAEVIPVLVNMVRRGLHNPRGLTGEQLGDYGWQAQNAVAAAGIYATRQERRIIRKAAGTLGAVNAELDSDLPLPPWRAGSEFEDKFLDSL